MTVIEIRSFRNGWQVYESAGVQPVFLNKEETIDYATGRACLRSGEIQVFGLSGDLERRSRFLQKQIERCDAVIRGYHEAGSVIAILDASRALSGGSVPADFSRRDDVCFLPRDNVGKFRSPSQYRSP